MSERVTPAAGGRNGALRIMGPESRGMVTLRADLADETIAAALGDVLPLGVPGRREGRHDGAKGALWMSPDELLLLCERDGAGALVARIGEALDGLHHLVADMSDARAVFTLEGEEYREVLAKLGPADMSPRGLAHGEVRRTRLGQIPAALWLRGDTRAEVICFRSVAGYLHDLLWQAAAPGGRVGYFQRADGPPA
ncbi:sarcosine oxidase subunit gamma [Profundibacterium mesophilum]|uniref:Sarcosine oxidase gamma subunit n=1 Tax=Profundibacterium mesophilum KAUST100406-0324 TaxID=1037889 RepID=A0A921P021_9RHOB|nr:sarcosine oxidase subunit gamma family protein [Profundibacterium mesophilum]KAF0676703.1 Sarcosine oxidase gamma subunit [Profundibacterium mesophilum KAUST100406-0324]